MVGVIVIDFSCLTKRKRLNKRERECYVNSPSLSLSLSITARRVHREMKMSNVIIHEVMKKHKDSGIGRFLLKLKRKKSNSIIEGFIRVF